MRKTTLQFFFVLLLPVIGIILPVKINAQEMLKNPGFEEWIGEALDYIDVWTSDAATKETAITRGEHSLAAVRIEGLPQEFRNRLSQTIETRFIAGETYRFTIWYNVLRSVNGQDIKITSAWYDHNDEPMEHEAEILNNGEKFTSSGGWTEKSFELTAPEGAKAFLFRLVTQNGATIIYDDFSFFRLNNTPEIIVNPLELPRIITTAGVPATAEPVTVRGNRLTSDILLQIEGTDASVFSVSPAIIGTTSEETGITITYCPPVAGEHSAMLKLSSEGATPVILDLNGTCTGQPLISVFPAQPGPFSAKTGTESEQTVYVSGNNLTDYIYASIDNNKGSRFRISTTIFLKDADNAPLIITYRPETEGTHTADIVLKSRGAGEVRIPVSGTSSATETEWLENFETGSKNDETHEYVNCSKGSWEFAGARLGKEAGYDRFNSAQSVRLVKNGGYVAMDFDLTDGINTISLLHGSCESQSGGKWQLQVSDDFGQHWTPAGEEQIAPAYADGLQPVSFDIMQKGLLRIRIAKTAGDENGSAFNIDDIRITSNPGNPGGDLFRLDMSEPRRLLNESFDNIRNNKALTTAGWRNAVIQGARPWWGYTFTDTETDEITESAAKATAFIYNSDQSDPFEMWLITPPLDYKNTQNRTFTFRVMGDLMFEGHESVLELYYMEVTNGEPYYEKLETGIPNVPDDNGVWREFHVNLEGLNLADTFFMGFRFLSPSGRNNSVVYYIDNVTYGRTDLPVLNTETSSISLTCETYGSVSSEEIEITSLNLTEPVTISVGGANKSRFKPSVETLPAEGGKLYVTFSPMEEGIHSAYLKISSPGAADRLVTLTGTATTPIPRILVAEKDRDIELIAEGTEDVISEPVIVNPFLLTEDIVLNLEGPDAPSFSLSGNTIPATGINESFTVTYHPTGNEVRRAVVRLSSSGSDDVTIRVTGKQNGSGLQGSLTDDIRIKGQDNGIAVIGTGIVRIEMFDPAGRLLQTVRPQHTFTLLPTKGGRGCYIIRIRTLTGVINHKILLSY